MNNNSESLEQIVFCLNQIIPRHDPELIRLRMKLNPQYGDCLNCKASPQNEKCCGYNKVVVYKEY